MSKKGRKTKQLACRIHSSQKRGACLLCAEESLFPFINSHDQKVYAVLGSALAYKLNGDEHMVSDKW